MNQMTMETLIFLKSRKMKESTYSTYLMGSSLCAKCEDYQYSGVALHQLISTGKAHFSLHQGIKKFPTWWFCVHPIEPYVCGIDILELYCIKWLWGSTFLSIPTWKDRHLQNMGISNALYLGGIAFHELHRIHWGFSPAPPADCGFLCHGPRCQMSLEMIQDLLGI